MLGGQQINAEPIGAQSVVGFSQNTLVRAHILAEELELITRNSSGRRSDANRRTPSSRTGRRI